MVLKFYNTLTRLKEEFKPIVDKKVGIYSCGPTVYDFVHVGNLRSYVFADILKRVLDYNNFETKQVINITDVGHLSGDSDDGEDKVERSAKEKGKTVKDLADFYTDNFFKNLDELNIQRSEREFPKATDYIEEQIELIKKLEEKDFTYKTSDGVYFDTSKYPKYAELGKLNLEEQKEGARVEKNPEKKNPSDFALWKFSGDKKRLQEWDAPWGVGFPGWHIECSAMSMKFLGETFDIHTGGEDHVPLHHTNERAQSESATGKPFANYWLHNAFITNTGNKMAKSEGNFFTLTDLKKEKILPEGFRYWLLTAHYRSQLDFNIDAILSAQNALLKLVNFVKENGGEVNKDYKEKFLEKINDDLDTPSAIALIWTMLKDTSLTESDKSSTLLDFDNVLGLGLLDLKKVMEVVPEEAKTLLEARKMARDEGNFAESDRLRDELKQLNFEVKDTPDGQELKPIL